MNWSNTPTPYTTDEVIILINPATSAIQMVALDIPDQRTALLQQHPAGTIPITGELAQYLYLSLAGHPYAVQEPETASLTEAITAAYTIITEYTSHPHYSHVINALTLGQINPNLGVTLLDSAGRIIPNTNISIQWSSSNPLHNEKLAL